MEICIACCDGSCSQINLKYHLKHTVRKKAMNEEPKVKPIDYEQCTNAMLMLWIDDILTDGEYNRIMDKLNKAHKDGVI